MIPILYQENETNFNHNGIGILFDTMDYTVTEERNGPYELELVYPAGGRWAKELKDFRFISAKPNDEEDSHIFRIYETVKNLEEDTITVYAATKSNELGGNLVQNVSVTDVSAQQALNTIKAGLTQATSYNFISDIQITSSGSWDKQSPLSAIVGSDGSIVSKWGGELKRTNDTIYLYGRRGTNKVTTIRQGKGLVGFKMTTSIKGLVTTILPYFTYTPSNSDMPVTIKGSLVNSSLMSNYPVRYISAVDFSNHDGILPTTEGLTPEQYNTQVLNNLNTVASAYFVYMNPGCDKPKVTIEVDLAQLSDSSEYEQFRKLEHIALTDTVVVWVEKFNIDVEVTINEVTYNGMSERVTKFVAGSAKSGIIQDSEKRYTEQIDKIVEYVNTVENGIYNSIRISADSKNNIFSGYTTPDESLVKFDDIWYKPVADGEIEMYRWDGDSWVLAVVNADRIAIGTLDANRINVVNLNASNLSTGTVTGASGGWNLVTGEFWLGSSKANSKFLWDGDSLTIKVGSGQTVEEYVSNAIVATDVEYYLSTSSTALSGGGWSTTAPEWFDGKFMWSRTKVTFKSGTVQYRPSTTGVCIAGAKGDTGATGATGTGITSITEEYYLSTSKTTQTGGSWVTNPPAWVNGSYLWTRSKIVYSNPTSTVYTTPVVSSEWEAVTDLEFGGRNLLRDSGRLVQNANYGMADYYFTVPPLAGEKVTITLKGLLAATKSYFSIYNSGGLVYLVTLVDKGGGIYQATFDWFISSSSNTYITVYALTNTQTGTSRIDWIKLEKGNAVSDDWSSAPEELYTGITRIDKDGINVSKSTSDVNSQLAHDGLTVRDGDTILASFGEAGSVVPYLSANHIVSPSTVGIIYEQTITVGPGKQYSTINDALNGVFSGGFRYILNQVTFNIYGDINEIVEIRSLVGGKLLLRFQPGSKLYGRIFIRNCMSEIDIWSYNSSSVSNMGLVRPPSGAGVGIDIVNSAFVYVYGMIVAGSNSYQGIKIQGGGVLFVRNCDFSGLTDAAILAADGSLAMMTDNKGSNIGWAGWAYPGGRVYATGMIPTSTNPISGDKGFTWLSGTTPTASSYSPPAVTAKTFTQYFTSATFDTLVHGTTNVDSYYGAVAAQNRWDSNMGWKDGRIRFGAEISNFFAGGSNIQVQIRLRRKNSSHGNSGAVMPAPYNHSASFPSGATRGGWTGWATIPSSLFTTEGATLTYYNGVQGLNGYAIWDAVEVWVSVTKNV